ncbi:MAG: hypothetical protein V4590_14605 [Bacteroidota bacterium]
MKNQVSGSLNPDSMQKIKDCIANIKAEMPFLVRLTPEESKRIVRMQSGRQDFVNQAYVIASNNEQLKPQFFELGEFAKDIDLSRQLDEILQEFVNLEMSVVDTRDLAGSEAFGAGLEVYNTAKRGMAKGVDGAEMAYNELSALFDKQGRYPKPTNPNNPE